MSLYINTNTDAITASNNLNMTESKLSTAMTDLSSGLRINSAADDAAGYSIAQDLDGQVNGLNQASNNTQDAISLVQTADGSLNNVEQMLQRVRELAVEYNGGTLSSADQNAIVSEVQQLASEIDQIGSQAQFNGITLFQSATLTFQVGANDNEVISLSLKQLTGSSGILSALDSLGTSGTFSLGEAGILATIDSLINAVSQQASQLGSIQNRLNYTLNNLSTYSQNLTSAQSTIQDVNMAQEMTQFTQEQVLAQAGVSMLAQANQQPQMILKLLQ